LKVVWTADAYRDRANIISDIYPDNPGAAERMDALFLAAAARLERFPMIGRPGALSGSRELIPHPSYRLVYEIREQEIIVHALVHTARQWPPVADEGGN
jgi:addiction module RelE/StbE family toxin